MGVLTFLSRQQDLGTLRTSLGWGERNRGLCFALGRIPGTPNPSQCLNDGAVCLLHARHCIGRTLPTATMGVLGGMSGYLIRKDFSSLSKNGTPQMFSTVQVFSNKTFSLEDSICAIESCMRKAYLQFAQEAWCCLMLVSSAATAFMGCSHFFIH